MHETSQKEEKKNDRKKNQRNGWEVIKRNIETKNNAVYTPPVADGWVRAV